MNFPLNFLCSAGFSCVLLVAANVLNEPSVAGNSVAVASRPTTPGQSLLGSHARSKVMQYFDTYRNDPFGLPPSCVTETVRTGSLTFQDIPRIEVGRVLDEAERPLMVAAPADLVRVLPAGVRPVTYWLAGNHVIAMDHSHKIVDTVPIPTMNPYDRNPTPSSNPLKMVGLNGQGDL